MAADKQMRKCCGQNSPPRGGASPAAPECLLPRQLQSAQTNLNFKAAPLSDVASKTFLENTEADNKTKAGSCAWDRTVGGAGLHVWRTGWTRVHTQEAVLA